MLISPYLRKHIDKNEQHRVTLGNQTLVTVTSLHILGIQFCNDLPWIAHSNNVRQKMNCMIDVLKLCGRTMNTDVRQKVYNSFIAPRFDYCLPVWGHLPKASADRMDHCLVRMLRYILHDSSTCFTNTTYTSLGLRNFHHVVAVRCSSCLFTAMRQNKLGEIVLLDSNAVPTFLAQKRSDGAQKNVYLHTETTWR